MGQLENRAIAAGASLVRRAVEIAAAVHDQGGRVCTISATNDASTVIVPLPFHFENGAARLAVPP